MRHRKHRFQLGVKKEHRQAMMGNMAASLFRHGRIQTTLAKAKALRPFSEKIITLAKKAEATEDAAKKLHLRRLAIARVRDPEAVKILFNERASEFADRTGGYTRIYKLVPRVGDAADMAIIELISGDDEGYGKPKAKKKAAKKTAKKKTAAKKKVADEEEPAAEQQSDSEAAEVEDKKE